jgi:hypothetical protein
MGSILEGRLGGENSPAACGKLVEVFLGFQFSFGKDHSVGWTESL